MYAEYEIYKVADCVRDANDDSWYEYLVYLISDDGSVLDIFDSRIETYNGVEGQRLTKDGAASSAEEIVEDVDDGNADEWFNLKQ